MLNKRIIYFDAVFDAFKKMLYENKPEGFELQFWQEMNESEKKKELPQADYLLVAAEKLEGNILSRASKIKLVQKSGIGVDNIDIETATKLGLPVSNTPGANASGVAELTILLILALYRKLPLVNEGTKQGKWLMWDVRPTSFEMRGKTHGFIGFGNIGRETARRSKAFGTKVVYYDPFPVPQETKEELEATFLSLEKVLKTSDIISLHIPLLEETKGLIGPAELELMKRNAIIINVSRGGIIQEKALYEALNDGEIAGAGIDVWETEPIDKNNPLLTLDNIIASPHIGAGTRDTMARVLQMAFQNIAKVDSGERPDYVVNNVYNARVVK